MSRLTQPRSATKSRPVLPSCLRRWHGGGEAQTVVMLGAGASKAFDYPITRELMLRIVEGLASGRVLPGRRSGPDRKRLLTFLGKLMPGYRDRRSPLPMVTSILSLLDFSLATGQVLLPGYSLSHIRFCREALEHAVLQVIPDAEALRGKDTVRFNFLCEWLTDLKKRSPSGQLGLLTTNYDMMSDLAAMWVGSVAGTARTWSYADLARKIDFGFRWVRPDLDEEVAVPRPAAPALWLLKLHGSTNWLRCPLCENVYINPHGPIGWLASAGNSEATQCHCGKTRLEAQIVSPSFLRQQHMPNLIAVWKSALELLRQAQEWIFVGYSFPEEDIALRALFTRALHSNQGRLRITAIQPSDTALTNYMNLFPRRQFTYINSGFADVLEQNHHWSRK